MASLYKDIDESLRIKLWLGIFAAFLLLSGGSAKADPGARVRAVTGAHTRIVWCQLVGTSAHRLYDLVGLDTDDGLGIRKILRALRSCEKPLISPTGQRIVFSDRLNDKVCVVNWDGAGLKKLMRGYATDLWRDSQTSIEWVYVRTGDGRMRNAVWRYQLDQPDISELVWNKTPLDQEVVPWFQVSADGTHAVGAFPWPKCGVAILPNVSWRVLGSGCWTSIAPDNSYRFFHFDGTHKHIVMYDANGANRRIVKLSGAPGVNGHAVLYPKWSKDVRFLTVVGPEDPSGPDDINTAELYLGRFNRNFTGIDRWVRVTFNHIPDRWGDAWIDPGG